MAKNSQHSRSRKQTNRNQQKMVSKPLIPIKKTASRVTKLNPPTVKLNPLMSRNLLKVRVVQTNPLMTLKKKSMLVSQPMRRNLKKVANN